MTDYTLKLKKWVVHNGKELSDDLLVVTALWSAFTLVVNYLNLVSISAQMFFGVTTFLLITAYNFMVWQVNLEEELWDMDNES